MERFTLVFFVSGLLFATFGVSAYAANYSVQQYSWCGGPINPGDKCSNPYWWRRVHLDSLKTISFEPNDRNLPLSISDTFGNIWSISLAGCNSPIEADTGCSHRIDEKNSTHIAIDYSEWHSGTNPEDFTVEIVGDTEIHIFGPPNGLTYYVLDVVRNH